MIAVSFMYKRDVISKHLKMRNLIILLLLAMSTRVMAQSPWVKNSKETYFQLGYTVRPFYDEISGDDSYDTEREITDHTLQFYGEIGLTDKTTFLLSVPLKTVAAKDLVNPSNTIVTSEETLIALGNINVGLKHNFINKKWLFSGQLNVEANTSKFDDNSGLRSGFDAWTFTPLLVTGTSFDKWYVQGFTGVDIRTNDYSSAYKLGGEVGCKAIDWLWISGFFDGVFSFEDGDIVLPASNNLSGLYLNNQNYTALGLKFSGEINQNFGLNFAYGGAITAKNIGISPAITFGLYYKN